MPITEGCQAGDGLAKGACYKGNLLLRTIGAKGLRWMLVGVVALVGAASVAGLFGRFFWPLGLADIFRLQYVAVLVGATLGSSALRRFGVAGIAASLALLNIVTIGIPFAGPPVTDYSGPTRGSLRLLIANTETGDSNFEALERLIREEKPAVFGVVELTPALARQLERSFPAYRDSRVVAQEGAYGIGVFSRLPLLSTRVERFPSGSGPPSIVARLRVGREPVTVVVTHVHTPFAGSIHVRQLAALAGARSRFDERLAICGDFNTPPWAGPFRELAEDARLTEIYGDDAWSGYSWPTWNPLLRIPLDNCLIGGNLAVTDHRKGADIGSDHYPLVVDLAIR